jgi:8-oxo-dGTP pyrophosphatase MutT (NUDIX family)
MQAELAQIAAALARDGAGSSDFDLNSQLQPRLGAALRPAAVLIAIAPSHHGPQIILTKRASHLAHHPGQISFPGGKVDLSDASPTAAALREAREEIGLDPRDVRILGQLPHHETVTGFSMTPVLGALERLPDLTPDPAEVAEVFTVPFAFATNLQNFRIEGRIWQGQMRRFYTVPYGPYYIWGATARVLFGLAKRLAT